MSTVVDQPRPEGSETNKKLGLFKNNVDFEGTQRSHKRMVMHILKNKKLMKECKRSKESHVQQLTRVKVLQKKIQWDKADFIHDSKLGQIMEIIEEEPSS
mmetsp:Transcript_13529/g.23029  ORF Transcript_13529/g.23029 Transcript_13529/m.23029 type:complete len:100 (+) Transcript_13529:850-1149(+)